jgi:hypothetical protein
MPGGLAVRSLRSAARSVDYSAGSFFPMLCGLFQKYSLLPVAATAYWSIESMIA